MEAYDLTRRDDFWIPPGEFLYDTLLLVDILAAFLRAKPTKGRLGDVVVIAGALLCPIFRSEKGPKYSTDADKFRLSFAGITEDPSIAVEYVRSFTSKIFMVRSPDGVKGRRFSEFFSIEREMTAF